MNKYFYPLLIAQFLSAFADNAILFAVIAMVMQTAEPPSWYVPALQSVFLLGFVLLAPWVGKIADQFPKSRVLITANLIKACGAGLLLFKLEPLIAYSLVGVGAALYSPAKYGILPELAEHNQLVKANSWIEASTIFAILTGMLVGAQLADYSIDMALTGTIILFIGSAATSLVLPVSSTHSPQQGAKIAWFFRDIRQFLQRKRARFGILGASLFWGAAACVRVIIVAWAPLVLLSHNATDIANLTLFLALGIITGSAIVPRLIPLEQIARARFPAYLMGLLIIALGFCSNVPLAKTILFLMGTAGGMFIVPINATLQAIGQQSVGSGGAVAMQNFFQNSAMLIAVGGYTLAASLQINPVLALIGLGVLLLIGVIIAAWRMPKHSMPASLE